MTIIEQLARLAEIASDVCRQDDGVFIIGDYHFWDSPQLGPCARHRNAIHGLSGQPALAWLEAALRQVIEAQGWAWGLDYDGEGRYIALAGTKRRSGASPTEALLAALIVALGGRGMTIGDVIWMALQCAKDERQSLIDAYRGDESEEVVRQAKRTIAEFEKVQLKLFGTTRSRGDAIIDKMKPVDLFKLMAMDTESRWELIETLTTKAKKERKG